MRALLSENPEPNPDGGAGTAACAHATLFLTGPGNVDRAIIPSASQQVASE